MSLEQKTKGNTLAIFTAALLSIIKIAVAFITNSTVIFALALDSLGDIISSLFNRYFLIEAEKPADEDHHFGHGKIENFAALLQATFLIFISAGIFFKAYLNIITHTPILETEIGIGALVLVTLIGWFAARKIEKIAKSTDSPILETDALHIKADTYTHLGTIFMLLIIQFFGSKVFLLDPILSIFIAGYIAFSAFKIVKSSYDTLIDKALSEDENTEISNIIDTHKPNILEFKNLRTRKLGSDKNIAFDLIICRKLSLEKAHDITDIVEKDLEEKISRSKVFVHTEPCEKTHCPSNEDCLYDKKKLN